MLRKGPAGKSGIILGLFLVIFVTGISFGAGTAQDRALTEASEKGNLEDVKRLLNEGTDINAKDDRGRSPLMLASFKGHAEIVKFLLDRGADIDAKDTDGGTALMYASLRGHSEVVKVLLDKGADIDAKKTNGLTALMYASFKGHAEVVKALLDGGADVNAKEKSGFTALEIASPNDHPEVVKLLKAYGAKETSRLTSPSEELPMPTRAEMWAVAVLLLIGFVLILFAKIAKTQRMLWVFFGLGAAVWIVAIPLAYPVWYDDHGVAILGFVLLSQVIADLIARPILRKRVIRPCVRVRRTPLYKIVLSFFFIALGILFVTQIFRSPKMMPFPVLMTAWIIICLIFLLSERVEVCANGVWQHGGLHWFRPWEVYESFSWEGKTKDRAVLLLVRKSSMSSRDRLLVAPEDHEAVHQILEANLPHQSSGAEVRNT